MDRAECMAHRHSRRPCCCRFLTLADIHNRGTKGASRYMATILFMKAGYSQNVMDHIFSMYFTVIAEAGVAKCGVSMYTSRELLPSTPTLYQCSIVCPPRIQMGHEWHLLGLGSKAPRVAMITDAWRRGWEGICQATHERGY